MIFKRKFKRAMEVMRLRNKEYLNKMNAGNPDWDKENGAFYSDETPAENKAGSDIPTAGTSDDDIPAAGTEDDAPERGGDEFPVEAEKTPEGKKKKKKRGSWKEKGDDYRNVMEKGDLSAIILAAFLVFAPIFLIIILIMFFAGWLLNH